MIIPIFLTGLGCSKTPCVFCDQEIASNQCFTHNDEAIKNRIKDTIIQHLKPLGDNISYPVEIAFYGSSFTALDFAYQKELLKSVQETFEKITGKHPNGNMKIRISTRPDQIRKEELLDLKLRFNLHLVEMGVQSMDDEVLFESGRGHTRKDVKRAAKDIREIGLELSCHQMLGLPGADAKSDLESAKDIVKLKPKYVRIHPTLVLKGTRLEEMYKDGAYKPLDTNTAVVLSEKVLRTYRNAGIGVIRIGVHPSELLVENIVAGPWHPAFRGLVEGKYLMNEASTQLTDYKGQSVQINIAPQDETYIRGENNSNYNALLSAFKLKDLQINKNPNVQRGTITVNQLVQ